MVIQCGITGARAGHSEGDPLGLADGDSVYVSRKLPGAIKDHINPASLEGDCEEAENPTIHSIHIFGTLSFASLRPQFISKFTRSSVPPTRY